MKRNSMVALVLTLMLITLTFIGCSPSETPEPSTPADETPKPAQTAGNEEEKPLLDTSKRIELVVWFAGDPAPDAGSVIEELNKKLLEDFNCTMKINHLGWADYETRYSLLLNAKEECDILYSANWLNARDYNRKGAFLELDELLVNYAPELYEFLDRWEEVTMNGSIYAIPNNNVRHDNTGIVYREDLRKKYNLPIPDSVENIEAYFQGIKENEPTMLPTSDKAVFDGTMSSTRFAWNREQNVIGASFGVSYTGYDESKLTEITYDWETPEYLEMLKKIKEWADKGYWSRSLLSAQNDPAVDFDAGLTAAIFNKHMDGQSGHVTTNEVDKDEGWEIGFVPFQNKYGISVLTSAEQDMTVLPIQCKDPARAIAVVEKIFLDVDYFHLIQYGIKGVHYDVNENGEYTVGPKTEQFGPGGLASWCWRNVDFYLESTATPAKVEEMRDLMDTLTPVSPCSFSLDTSNISAEVASLENTIVQYLEPLKLGQHDDPEKGFEEFMRQAKIAGYDKVKEEFEKQWEVFITESGLK